MNPNPVSDTWERGSPYERYIGRWSRAIAPRFLSWLAMPPGLRWVDVGCGTGALCATVLDHAAPGTLIGVEPSDGFLRLAAKQLGDRAHWRAGQAESIPLERGSCDVVVSGLVLNFVPDLRAAMAEMRRVVVPGGTIAAYVWDYADRMEVIRRFWDAARAIDEAAAPLDEAARFPVCRPAALRSLFEQAGLVDVETRALELTANFVDFDDYWQPFLGGQGPAPSYLASLPDDRRAALRARLVSDLAATPEAPLALQARAWAVRGSSPPTL